MLKNDRGILESGSDEFVIDYRLVRTGIRGGGGIIPDALSILHARTWPSSFICDADRKAISSFRNARRDRCCNVKYINNKLFL